MDLGPRPPPEILKIKSIIKEFIQEKYPEEISHSNEVIMEILEEDKFEDNLKVILEQNTLNNEMKEILDQVIARAKYDRLKL